MTPLLDQGRSGIKKLADESDALGNTMTRVQANQLLQFEEGMKRLKAGVGAFERSIALALLPALENLATALFAGTKGANDFSAIAQVVGKVAAWLSNVIIELSLSLQGFVHLVKILYEFSMHGMAAGIVQVAVSDAGPTEAQGQAADATA